MIAKKDLSVRVHDCPECGLVLDRDHNAAINILNKAVAGLGLRNVGQWPERATGNIICEEIAA
jgi:putative transposase